MIQQTRESRAQQSFSYLVAIGASAGGLKPLEEFFDHMPPDSGLSFAVVQHLSPDFKSLMKELLSRHTKMAVHRVRDGDTVEPNSVYLIPPNKKMSMSNGRLRLIDYANNEHRLPISYFFESIASELGNRAVAVILSGTGTDGTTGVQAIHDRGGLVMVQDPVNSEFDGMPRSAISTEHADFVVTPREIARILVQYSQSIQKNGGRTSRADGTVLGRVVELLGREGELDFSQYKKKTLSRRLQRRMLLTGSAGEENYIELLDRDPGERDRLRNDLLIRVTSFFRDAVAWTELEKVVRKIVREADGEIRAWVTACGSGPEAYSLGMLLVEAMEAESRVLDCKIFATDVDQQSLEIASAGVYGPEVAEQVSAPRLGRFFRLVDGQYEISRDLRKMIIFAPHDVTRDTPFTRMHLVTCRNVLIYMEPPLQQQVLGRLHYALRKGGVLFLGPSETLGAVEKEFQPISPKWRIHEKSRDRWIPLDLHRSGSRPSLPRPPRTPAHVHRESLAMRAAESLYRTLGAICLVVNEQREALYVFGTSDAILQPPRGRVTEGFEMILNPEVATVVGSALDQVGHQGQPLLYRGVRLRSSPDGEQYDLAVERIASDPPGHYLVVFLPDQTRSGTDRLVIDYDDSSRRRIDDLETTLGRTRENLQATIEELETTNEEQQSTNEELIAANEELQSTNEELHSVNEELHTVNAELQTKIGELTKVNNDLDNLIKCTGIGTLFLDGELCLRRFTPDSRVAFNLLESDLHRPIRHITNNLDHEGFYDDLREALTNREVVERTLRTRQGESLLMRIQPYNEADEQSAGLVVNFVDVTALKRAEESLRESQRLLQGTINALSAQVVILDGEGRIVAMNHAWEESARRRGVQDPRAAVGQAYDSGESPGPSVSEGLEKVLAGTCDEFSKEYPLEISGQRQWFLVRGSRFEQNGESRVVVLHIDISSRREAEEALSAANEVLRLKNQEMEQFIYTVSHDLKSPLVTIAGLTGVLELELQLEQRSTKTAELLETIKDTSDHMRATIEHLLDYIRVGRAELAYSSVSTKEVVEETLQKHRHKLEESQVVAEVDASLPVVLGDRLRMSYVFDNLITNALQYGCTDPGDRLEVFGEERPSEVCIHVRDFGPGVASEHHERIFKLFERASEERRGTGVGLAIVKRIMEAHGGRAEVRSNPGDGADFFVVFPKDPASGARLGGGR